MVTSAATKAYPRDIPEFFNIGEACTRLGRKPHFQNRTAMTLDHGHHSVAHISYRQLEHRSRQFASALLALGLAPQQRVLLRLPNCLHYPAAFMGTLLAGGIALPASPLLRAQELTYICQDADISILVTTTAHLPQLPSIASTVANLRHIVVSDWDHGDLEPATLRNQRGEAIALHSWCRLLAQSDYLEDHCQTRADDPAYLVYTSGTTGYPKGVLHAHRALLGRQPASEYWFDFQGDDRILHSGKLNWTYVLGSAMMDPFYRGKSVVLYEGKVTPDIWPQLIARHRCTLFIGVPTVYRQILQKTRYSARDVPSLRYCMSAGEHLSDTILTQWQQRFKQAIYEAVGMSECSYYLSHHSSRALRPGSAGMPQPGHRVALLDPDMVPVADDTEGMLCIPLDDPGLFIRYWGLQQETANCRRKGYFLTGDYARRDRDGYIWFLGRKDDMINSMGYRISPIEIERVIKSMPGVAECIVVDERVARDTTIVTACIIQQPPAGLDTAAVIAYAAEHLAAYKLPKKIRFMTRFPRTANGKVLRRRLRASLNATG